MCQYIHGGIFDLRQCQFFRSAGVGNTDPCPFLRILLVGPANDNTLDLAGLDFCCLEGSLQRIKRRGIPARTTGFTDDV